tara:strand:- start:4007 stop:8839 length:4833 start_codon:yes stop_codon:yes gene_type:complete
MVKNLNTIDRSERVRLGKWTADHQPENTVVLNATGEMFPMVTANSFYVAPLRYDLGQRTSSNTIVYNYSTKEIVDIGPGSISGLDDILVSSNVSVHPMKLVNNVTGIVTTSNVGVGNLNPIHLLDVGNNFYVTRSGDVSIGGSLNVTGNTTIDAHTLKIKDSILEIGSDNTLGVNDLGFSLTRPGAASNVAMVFDERSNVLSFGYSDTAAQSNVIAFSNNSSNGMSMRVYGDFSVNEWKMMQTDGITNTINYADNTTSITAPAKGIFTLTAVSGNAGYGNTFEVKLNGTRIVLLNDDNMGPVAINTQLMKGDVITIIPTGFGFTLSNFKFVYTDTIFSLMNENKTNTFVVYDQSRVGILKSVPTHTLDVGSNLYVDDSGSNVLGVTGNTFISGELDVIGNVNFSNNLIIGSNLDIGGDVTSNLDILGNVSVGREVSITGNTVITGNITTSNNLTVAGGAVITGNIETSSNLTVSGNAEISGNIVTNKITSNTLNVAQSIDISSNLTVGGNLITAEYLTVGKDANIAGNTVTTSNLIANKDVDIFGNTVISGNLTTSYHTTLHKNANIYGNLITTGNLTVSNNLTVTRETDISGNLATTGNITTSSNLTVAKDARVSGNATVTGNLSCEGHIVLGNLIVNKDSTVTGNLLSHGNITTRYNLTVDEEAAITGNLVMGGNITTSSNLTVSKDATVTGNLVTTANISTDYNLTVAKEATITGNLATNGNITTSSNLTVSKDATVTGNLAATGNISTAYNLTVEKEATITGNLVTDGNITTSSNLTVSKDATVTGNLATTGNISTAYNLTVAKDTEITGNLETTGNIEGAYNLTVAKDAAITGNLTTTGNVSTSYNLTVAKDAAVTGNLETTGNITGSYNLTVAKDAAITGNLTTTANISTDYNLTVEKEATVSGNLATTGNVTTSSNLTVAKDATITGNIVTEGNITTSKSLTVSGNVDISGNVSISGNLIHEGKTTVINAENVVVKDPITLLGNGFSSDTIDFGHVMKRAASNVVSGYMGDERKYVIAYTESTGLTPHILPTAETMNVHVYGKIFTESNVGIMNTEPTHQLSIGNNIFADNGRVSATEFSGDGGLLSNIATTLQSISDQGNVTSNTIRFTNSKTGFVVSSNAIITGNLTASNVGIANDLPTHQLSIGTNVFIRDGTIEATQFDGDGGLLSNIATTLQSISDQGNVTSNTIQFTNSKTGFIVSSNADITGNLTASNVGIANALPTHQLSIGTNVFIRDGTIEATQFDGDGGLLSNIATTLQSITDQGNTTSNTVQFTNADVGFITTANVGIANSAPTHSLAVGSNLYIDEFGSNVLVINGNVATEKITLGNVAVSAVYTLSHIANRGNVTSNTIQFTNPNVALTATGNVEIGTGSLYKGDGGVLSNVSAGALGSAVTMTSTDTSSSAGPEFTLYRNSASAANNDYLGQLKFSGKNAGGNTKIYAKMTAKANDVTTNAEKGLFEFAIRKAGSLNICARLTSTDLKLQNGTGLEVQGNTTIGESAGGSAFKSIRAVTVSIGGSSTSRFSQTAFTYGHTYSNAAKLIFSVTITNTADEQLTLYPTIANKGTSGAKLNIRNLTNTDCSSTANWNVSTARAEIIIYELP